MKVIPPDPGRTVDLPGVGPCPRPVDVDQGVTGFSDLVSLRVYDFAEGPAIEGEAEEDEVIVTLLAGAVAIEVTGALAGEDGLSFTLALGGDGALYLPPRHHYRLEPLAPSTIAYARARARAGGAAPPRSFAPVGGVVSVAEPAERLRVRLIPLEGETDASGGLGADGERLALVTGPATLEVGGTTAELGAMDAVALSPGEEARVVGGPGGELLAVAALRPQG